MHAVRQESAGRTTVDGVSRREVLRASAAGLSALFAPAALTACGSSSGTGSATTSVALPPFGGTGPAGPPTSLPRRVAWANTSDTEIFVALGQGIEAAARDRNLDYLTAIAANDPARNVSQMNTFLARGIGSMAVQPLDPVAQRTPLDHALKQGVFVQGIITNPSTLQVAASQYHIGFTQGKAAADYARGHLGGQAQVHYFNQDQLSPQLKVRHQGVLAGLKTGGSGVQVVSDLSANAADGSIEGGFRLMSTVMEAHPRIKIVLGSDTLVTGAYRALEQTGKLTPDMYLSGVDGDSNALALVKEGGPYRASLAFAWSLMGYGMGRFAADWIDGRSVPRIMVARAVLLDSPALVDEYLADNADPAGVFADGRRYQHYLPLLGNVSYATRHTVWQQEYVPR